MASYRNGAFAPDDRDHPLPKDKEELRKCHQALSRVWRALDKNSNFVKIASLQRKQGLTSAWTSLVGALFGMGSATSALQFIAEQIGGDIAAAVVNKAIENADGVAAIDGLADALGVTDEAARKSRLPEGTDPVNAHCREDPDCRRYYALLAKLYVLMKKYHNAVRVSDTVFGAQTVRIRMIDDA